MNNFDFLKTYGDLQYQIMSSRFIDLGYARVTYSAGDPSEFWNYALTSQLLDYDQLIRIEKTLSDLNRKSTVYFENCPQLLPLEDFLKEHKYQHKFEDSWMFYAPGQVDDYKFDSVRKVSNEKELQVFLETFDACYQKDDPQNVYGELGEYLNVTRDVWHKYHFDNRLEYFIVYDQSAPVAVSTLTNHKSLGYISNVGSLRSVRGKGFGKIATLYCVDQSIKHGNNQHFLATEEGTYPNEFYKRIGFTTRFTAKGMTKL